MRTLQLPFVEAANRGSRVLIAGAGGGFDVFSGLPLYFALKDAGKAVFLANLTFSELSPHESGRHVAPSCVEVTADSEGSQYYFPEKHLSEWFRTQGEEIPVYCFQRTGPKPLRAAYQALVESLHVDTIVLVDGGTDSLMRGDEQDLGTPMEDMASIAATCNLDVPCKMLVCLGFGIDAFHGVCHAHVLEAIADLSRNGGYLGAFSLLQEMSPVRRYMAATEYALEQTRGRASVVCSSILSALEGRYGDCHRTDRTAGSELFINPLMSLYWCFGLEHVARRILFLPGLCKINTWVEVQDYITTFHAAQNRRPCRPLPL